MVTDPVFTPLNQLLREGQGPNALISFYESFTGRLFQARDFKTALLVFYQELRKLYREQQIEFILVQNPQRLARFCYSKSHKRLTPTGEYLPKDTLHHYTIFRRLPILTNQYSVLCKDLRINPNGIDAHAWVSIPMVLHGKVLGTLVIWDNRPGHHFRLHDKQFLNSMVGVFCFAVESIYLHDYIGEKNGSYKLFDSLLPRGKARNSIKNVVNQLQHTVLQQQDPHYSGLFIGLRGSKKWRLISESFTKSAFQDIGVTLAGNLNYMDSAFFNEQDPIFWRFDDSTHPFEEIFTPRLTDSPARSMLLFPFVILNNYPGVWILLLKKQQLPEQDALLMYQFIFYVMTQLIEKKAILDQNRKYQNYTKHLERMKVLGELASGTMHNMNNILSVIIGKTQLLLKRSDIPRDQRDLKLILKFARDGANGINRLQNYATAKSGEEGNRSININTLIQEVLEIARPRYEEQAQSQGISYDIRVDYGEIKPITGDAPTLREALLNLINNALDAMPGGGNLSLKTGIKRGLNFIFVKDSGVGIPIEVQDKIFEPFFSTKGSKGNGLGLSIAAEIIGKHQGSIHVESSLGKGAVFLIELPASGHEIMNTDPSPEFYQPLSYKVLLVEDKGEVRETLCELLEEEGCEVISAANANEALLKFQKFSCDVVLADLSMPGINGVELAGRLKTLKPKTPVFIITGWNQVNSSMMQNMNTVDGIIKKPLNMEQIRHTLLTSVRKANGHYQSNGFTL